MTQSVGNSKKKSSLGVIMERAISRCLHAHLPTHQQHSSSCQLWGFYPVVKDLNKSLKANTENTSAWLKRNLRWQKPFFWRTLSEPFLATHRPCYIDEKGLMIHNAAHQRGAVKMFWDAPMTSISKYNWCLQHTITHYLALSVGLPCSPKLSFVKTAKVCRYRRWKRPDSGLDLDVSQSGQS